MRVHHLAVVVDDLARAERFWVELVGLPVVRRWTDAAGAPRSIWVDLEGPFLAIEKRPAPGAKDPIPDDDAPGFHCVALAIRPEEREIWRARLEAGGHPVERESDFTLYVRDPEHNLVAFSHWPVPARSRREATE